MKSVMILASAGMVAAQAITADIAAISSGVAQLNSQVSAFTALPQASAIVDTSNQIVSAIEKGTSDAKSGGSIPDAEAVNLVSPFSALNNAVGSVISNLVAHKPTATSLSLGNVVEAQIVQQLSAAQAFASAVVAEVPTELQPIASGLAASIIQNLSSGSAAFAGLSGPSTLGGAAASTGASSAPASSAAASTGSHSAASSAAASTGSAAASSAAATTSAAVKPSGNSTAPSSSPSVVPSTGGAEKALIGFAGAAVAAFAAMLAL